MPKRGTQTRKRGAKSNIVSASSGARAHSRSKLEPANASAVLSPKLRRILQERLATLAPSEPMAHERARAESLFRRAPAKPPARVKRAGSPKEAGA